MVGARRFWLVVVAVVALFGAAACGGDDDKAVDVGEDSTNSTDADTTDGDDGDAAALFADEDCSFYLDALANNPLAGAGAGAEDLDFAELGNAFQDIADKAPDELADDFALLGEFYEQYAPVMQELVASGGQPDPETLAELQELGASVDQEKLQQASTNISTYFQEECGAGVTGSTGG
jgi:hypothetical protein